MHSTACTEAAHSIGAGTFCWRGSDELQPWNWSGRHCRSWRNALHDRSWRGITYGWCWRGVLAYRHQCSIHCRAGKAKLTTGAGLKYSTTRAGAVYTAGAGTGTALGRRWSKVLHHKRWCGKHRVREKVTAYCIGAA